jgi:hypothetical protein
VEVSFASVREFAGLFAAVASPEVDGQGFEVRANIRQPKPHFFANIRVHSCVFVVNIRRWLRLTTGE